MEQKLIAEEDVTKQIRRFKPMKCIACGVEIECVINSQIHESMEIGGDYGWRCGEDFYINSEDRVSDYWETTRDSSISRDNKFPVEECVEFIGGIFRTKKRFFEGLTEFQKEMSCDGKYELNKVMYFNKSVGCHIHFSIRKFSFNKKGVFEVFKDMRNYFYEKLENSNLQKQIKEIIKSQYGRSYSKLITKNNWRDDRYEFNLDSEDKGKGLEWRSFNLTGIKTWEEFNTLFEIAWNCLEWLYNNGQKYEVTNNMRVDTNKIKKDIEEKSKPQILKIKKEIKNQKRNILIKGEVKTQKRNIKIKMEKNKESLKVGNKEKIDLKLTPITDLNELNSIKEAVTRARNGTERDG